MKKDPNLDKIEIIKLGKNMSKKQFRNFTAEQKSKIVLELLKEENTIAQIGSKYEIDPRTLGVWKKQFLSNAALAFEPTKAISEYKEQIDKLREQNDELAKALGKATVERDWAVGKLKGLDLSNKKSLVNFKPDTLTKARQTLTKARQCELLDLNRSSLYYKRKGMSEYNLNILNKIDEIYTDNPVYGYRYIYRQLLEEGFDIGKDRVLKYMNILGLEAICPKKKKSTSIKDNEHKIYPYLLCNYWNADSKNNRILQAPCVGEVWSSDITYVRTKSGFMYLAAIIDWGSRAVLSYKLSNTMDVNLVTDILQTALSKYPTPKIFNSDQGSQYTSREHTQILQEHKIAISMNGKGRSIDNIVIERFFRTLKYNCIYINDFKDITELKEGIDRYINNYNNKRFHSAINYQKPMNLYLNHTENLDKIAA